MRIWHCETQEEYDYLMKQLEAEGCEWESGNKPTELGHWSNFENLTCVRNRGSVLKYGTLGYYKHNFPGIEIQPVVIPEQKQDKENKKMNKQELIEKLGILPKYSINAGRFYNIGIGFRTHDVLELVEQLDEPQKVVLPRDVAEWFGSKVKYLDLLGLLDEFKQKWFDDYSLVVDFVDNHCEGLEDAYRKIARAYLDGYEVEKEKLYTVVMSSPNESNSNSHKSFLMRTETGKIILKHGNFNIKDHTKLTEAEIKSVDERYMAFAKEVTG